MSIPTTLHSHSVFFDAPIRHAQELFARITRPLQTRSLSLHYVHHSDYVIPIHKQMKDALRYDELKIEHRGFGRKVVVSHGLNGRIETTEKEIHFSTLSLFFDTKHYSDWIYCQDLREIPQLKDVDFKIPLSL